MPFVTIISRVKYDEVHEPGDLVDLPQHIIDALPVGTVELLASESVPPPVASPPPPAPPAETTAQAEVEAEAGEPLPEPAPEPEGTG